MEYYEISFGKIIILRNDLAEVIVNEGVEIDTVMVTEFHQCLLTHFANSFSLLITKVNSYSTKFDAMVQCGTLAQLEKMAVFAPSRKARLGADLALNVPRPVELDIQIFTDREEALAWL